MDDEKTIDFTLDKLDFEPNSVFGFTMTEYLQTIGCFSPALIALLGPTTLYLLGSFMYGAILGFMGGLGLASYFAFKGETYKKGRPSYMIWVDLRFFMQQKFKIKMGFINSNSWDTCYERENTRNT